MLTKLQAGSVPCGQKFFCKWNLSFFKAVPPNSLSFYLGSMLHIINSLFSNFRSWDYPEHFGIYFQLDRKSETWFFMFFNVYVSWTELDKILISELSPPKFRYFADQNGPKEDPMKMNFDNFQMQKWGSKTDRARKTDEKNGVLSLVFMSPELWWFWNCQKLCPFCNFFWCQQKI